MLHARQSDHATWYLFDMLEGPHWFGYKPSMAEAK